MLKQTMFERGKLPAVSRLLVGVFLSVAVILAGSQTAWADAFASGVSAYKARYYDRAAQYFQQSLKEGQKDPNAVFYLGMAYTHLKRYDEARQAFELLIQNLPPNHELAVKARNNISYLTNQQIALASNSAKAKQIMNVSLSRSSKDNYLTHVIPGGKVVHFSRKKMPLKVYIADGLKVQGWNANMKQAIVAAMKAWQSGTHGKVLFSQTYSEANADIIVRWQRNFSDNILGVSPFQSVGDTIIRSDITLAVYYPDTSVPIPYGELVSIATHEMGHAIGLKGHSPYPGDIMFYSLKRGSNQSLSARDINTLSMLYKVEADVQNNTTMSTAQSKQYYELYRAGLKAQTSNQSSQAISYYRQAIQLNPSMVEARFNLGALLINEGNKMVRSQNLSGAKRNFEEATRLYSAIAQDPKAPDGTQENLQIARNNLAILNNAQAR